MHDTEKWRELTDGLRDKKKGYHALAKKLREAADYIDLLAEGKKSWPDVYGCDITAPGEPMFKDSFIERISVTLSHPWPG